MRRAALRLIAAGLALTGTATGCVTRTPSATDHSAGTSRAVPPSLAATLPALAVPSAGASPSAPGHAPGPVESTATTGPRKPATTASPRTAGKAPPAAAGATRPAHVPATAELRRALLGPGDLPGFQVDSDTGSGGGEGGCPVLDTDFSGGASAKAEVLLFHSSSTEPVFVRERIRQLGVPGARAALGRVRGAPGGCGRFTTTVDPLGEVAVTVGTLGIAPVGDEAAAVRITMRPRLAAVVAVENLVLVRRGGTLIILSHTSLSAIDDRLTSRAVAEAYAKTESVW